MIPIATAHIDIYRGNPDLDPEAEGYDGPYDAPAVVESGVRAIISGPFSTTFDGMEVIRWHVRADRCDLRLNDHLVWVEESLWYRVTKVDISRITDFGLDHVIAELTAVVGLPSRDTINYDS